MRDPKITTHHIASRDGTLIGYNQRGSGPGLILIQGAMGTCYNYADLARALSPYFTVYSPDRRGRGLSPLPYTETHTIARDVEDVDALLAATGARRIFGLSSGAMIALEAARTLERLEYAAVYEPPFYPDGISHAGIARLNAEIEAGDFPAALFSALMTAETAPAPLRMLPRLVATLLLRLVLWVDGLIESPYAKLMDLLPGIRFDFNVVEGMDGRIGSFQSVEKPVLLLSGTKSPAFLRWSVRELAGVLHHVRHVELEGLGHDGPWNSGRGGRPDVVVEELREFFISVP